MVEQRVCSFCGYSLEPGSGTMFVKKDGSVYFFDKRRCQVSMLKQGRLARRIKWTRHYPRAGQREALEAQAVAAEVAKAQAAAAAGAKKPAKAKR